MAAAKKRHSKSPRSTNESINDNDSVIEELLERVEMLELKNRPIPTKKAKVEKPVERPADPRSNNPDFIEIVPGSFVALHEQLALTWQKDNGMKYINKPNMTKFYSVFTLYKQLLRYSAKDAYFCAECIAIGEPNEIIKRGLILLNIPF
jgi:hypothetical protein